MPKLSRIERLIEMEIPRVTLPEEYGATPEWKASSNTNHSSGGGNNKNRKKKFFGKKKKVE
jgi:hypothetical protein